MKKLLLFTIYLFYRYYNRGSSRSIAYEASIMAVSFIIFMNLAALSIILKIDVEIINFLKSNNGFIKLLKGSLLLIPLFLILGVLFKRNEIKKLKFDKDRIKRGNILLVCYIIISFLAIVLLAAKDNFFNF